MTIRHWALASSGVVVTVATLAAQSAAPSDYPIQPVPMSQVKVTGGFWQAKLETNRTVTIPHILEQNEKTGRVDNLRKGAGLMPGDYAGRRFNDTDIYKIVEAASYSLISHPGSRAREAARRARSRSSRRRSSRTATCFQRERSIRPSRRRASAPSAGSTRTPGATSSTTPAICTKRRSRTIRRPATRALLDVAIKNANLVATTFGPDAQERRAGTRRGRAGAREALPRDERPALPRPREVLPRRARHARQRRRRTTRSRAGSSTTIGRTARTTCRSSTSRARRGTPCAAPTSTTR